MLYHAMAPSSLGTLLLRSDGGSLAGLYFVGQRDCPDLPDRPPLHPPHFNPAAGLLNGRPIRNLTVSRGLPLPLADRIEEGIEPSSLRPAQRDTPASALAVFEQAIQELSEYLRGRRREFEVPLAPRGTAFQQRIWAALLEIPYGTTVSYGEVARQAGLSPGHGRAVGAAVGRNPVSILIPCHRVLAAGGTLNGYSGGLERKVRLLAIEDLHVH